MRIYKWVFANLFSLLFLNYAALAAQDGRVDSLSAGAPKEKKSLHAQKKPTGGITAEKVSLGSIKLQEALALKKELLQDAEGKTAVVVMGNTGVGKSTLVNLIAGIRLRINDDGEIENSGSEGVPVGGGFSSITKYPECVVTSSGAGRVYDLPGFQDTDGVLDDLVNAAFIHRILTVSSAVKVVFVTSLPEIRAVRGDSFKKLAKIMQLLPEGDIRSQGCMLIVNRAEKKTLAETFHGLEPLKDQGFLSQLLQSKNVVLVPQIRVGDEVTALDQSKKDIISMVTKLKSYPVRNVNISVTFNGDTTKELVEIYYSLMKETVFDMRKGFYHSLGRRCLQDIVVEARGHFESKLATNEFIKAFSPLSNTHYKTAYDNFDFGKEHKLIIQELQVSILQEENKAAQKNREEQERRIELAKREIQDARAKESEMQSIRVKAEQEARKEAEKARALQARADVNEKERLLALKKAEEREQEARKALQTVGEHQQTMAALQSAKKKAEESLQSIKAMQERSEQERRNAEQRLADMRRDFDSRESYQISSLQREIERLKSSSSEVSSLRSRIQSLESDVSSKDSTIAELRREIERLRLSRVSGGGGGVVFVPGIGFMQHNPYGY